MKLLSLPTALLFAAVAVPLLLLLYFLKLRRQERKVPSTLLWKKAVQDLQVNAPFQKLRRNLLLFLQLLLMAAVLFGLANPVANFNRVPEQSVVLLVDASGSMRALEAGGAPRIRAAKDTAVRFVAGLPSHSRAMIISFSDRARVESPFTTDQRRLKSVIESIEPTCGPSRIGEALQLAVAYSSNLVEDTGMGVPEAAKQGSADIELFSDGRIGDAAQQFVTRGKVHYYPLGDTRDNAGIVAFDVRRDFERPGYLSVFARVENFGPAAVKGDVSLSLDGRPIAGGGAVREIALGPAEAAATQPAQADRPGAASTAPAAQNVIFELQHDAGGILEVEWHRRDALSIDNKVVAPLDPPRPIRVLAVTGRNEIRSLLQRVMAAFEIEAFDLVAPAEYESMPEARLQSAGRSNYELIILDNHDTARLPPGNYVFWGGLPKVDGISRGPDIEGKPIVYGQQSHPLLRSVNYDGLYISKWKRLVLPKAAIGLLEGEDSTVLAFYTDPGHRYVLGAFDLLETDLPFRPAYLVLMQNIITHLAGGGLVDAGRMIGPGDTIALSIPPGAKRMRITHPGDATEEVDVADRLNVAFARTQETGIYRGAFDDGEKTTLTFAVNLLDRNESNIPPNPELVIGSDTIPAEAKAARVNEPLWPYAVAAALALLLLEWWIYNKRVML